LIREPGSSDNRPEVEGKGGVTWICGGYRTAIITLLPVE